MAAIAVSLGVTFAGAPAIAVGLSEQTPITVDVNLGTKDGVKIFEPNALTFKAGKLYKLVLHNESPTKHYFLALRFANAVWTRKVEMEGVEIKGRPARSS